MILSDLVGIIADDLTGANDTALQFQQRGASTKILLDAECEPKVKAGTEVWALSSESRNVPVEVAISRVERAVTTFTENFTFDYYYKKIDSTLRGHIALETLTMLNILEYDAAIIIPAFPQEGRITVGGYHMAKGVPIGRTEIAIDPHSPITESHVPTLLKMQLGEPASEMVGTIDLRTVMNGAGPVLVRINELLKEGKKLIVADATSLTDIEQIALAINKCDKKLLPTGTAAGAQVLSKYWLAGLEKENTDVKRREQELIEKAKIEARNIVLSAKEDVNAIIREMNKLEKEANGLKNANQLRNKLNDRLQSIDSSGNNENRLNLEILKSLNSKTQMKNNSLSNSGSKNNFSNISKNSNNKQTSHSSNSKVSFTKNDDYKSKNVSSEINVIGLNVDDATFLVDKYIDDCAIAKLSPIRIVHGKGTGKSFRYCPVPCCGTSL